MRVPQREGVVTFEGTPYEGAEVRLRLSAPMKLLFQFQSMDGSDAQSSEETVRMFGDKLLISWNFETEDGDKLPANADGLLEMPMDFTVELFRKWAEAATGIPAPLGAA